MTQVNAAGRETAHADALLRLAQALNVNAPIIKPSAAATVGCSAAVRAQLHHSIDRACRDLVEELPLPDVLRTLCQGIAEVLALPLVTLVRRHAGGTLDLAAVSRETSVWAELTRLPERWDGTVAGHGPAARALCGGEPIGMPVGDEGFLPWRDAARRDGIVDAHAWPLDTADGVWAMVLYGRTARENYSNPCHDEAGGIAATGCGRVIDACARLERQRLLHAALDHAGNAAFVADLEGSILWSNAAFSRLTGYRPEDVRGRNPRFLSSGRHGASHYRELWNTIRTGRVWRGETVDRDSSGTAFTAIQTISPFGSGERITHYLAIYEDISRQKAEQVRRELHTGQDPLTGLMHRAALEYALAEELAQARPVHIALVALRNLRAPGPLGEDAREALSAECNARVRGLAGADRATMVAAGEYLLQLPDAAEQAGTLLDAIRRELAEPYPGIGEPGSLDLRIGCAQAPRDGTTLDALVRVADRALGVEPLLPARRALPPSGN